MKSTLSNVVKCSGPFSDAGRELDRVANNQSIPPAKSNGRVQRAGLGRKSAGGADFQRGAVQHSAGALQLVLGNVEHSFGENSFTARANRERTSSGPVLCSMIRVVERLLNLLVALFCSSVQFSPDL